jgi:ABC-2 type transport system permease protein
MTIAVTTPRAPATRAMAGAPPGMREHRAGFAEAVRAEATKLATLRSTKWALALTIAGTVAVSFLSTHGARHQAAGFYRNFDPTNQSLAGLAIGSLVIGVLGVLSMTGEYGSGTIRTSLSAQPRRHVFFAAKATVFAVFALIVGVAMSFLSFFVGQAVLSGGAPTAMLGDPGVLRALLESAGFLALLALFGLGIGAIIRHSAGAIATFVGCTLLLPIVLDGVAGHPDRFLPEPIYANSVAAVVRQGHALSSTQGFLLMVAYTLVSLLAGAFALHRRDA